MIRTLALLLLLALPAAAQDRPMLTPQRDVMVTYRVAAEGQTGEMRMAWLAGPGLLRMDMPGGQGWIVVNLRDSSGFLVMEPTRAIMPLPPGASAHERLSASPTARFTREREDRVAGLPCTVWQVEERDEAGRLCITGEGVVLRADGTRRNGQGRMEATAVSFAAQDPARFRRPEGFREMNPFSGTRGSALPPPGLR
jgi:hypothetical protein